MQEKLSRAVPGALCPLQADESKAIFFLPTSISPKGDLLPWDSPPLLQAEHKGVESVTTLSPQNKAKKISMRQF